MTESTTALAATTATHSMDVTTIAEIFCRSGWAGKASSDVELFNQVVVKLLWGSEMGLGPVASVQGIDVIQGKPSPSGGLIAAQLEAHPSYAYELLAHERSVCRLAFFVGDGLAFGSPWRDKRIDDWIDQHGLKEPCPPGWGLRPGCSLRGTEEYTIADAETAGLLQKTNWRAYPRAMLFNRAITEGQKAYAPNLFQGLKVYTPDELGAETIPAVVTEVRHIDGHTTFIEPGVDAHEETAAEAEELF